MQPQRHAVSFTILVFSPKWGKHQKMARKTKTRKTKTKKEVFHEQKKVRDYTHIYSLMT